MDENLPSGDAAASSKEEQTSVAAEDAQITCTPTNAESASSNDADKQSTDENDSNAVVKDTDIQKTADTGGSDAVGDGMEVTANADNQATASAESTQRTSAAALDMGTKISAEQADIDIPAVLKLPPEPVDIKIIYNKKKYDHSTDLNNTILDLKREIEKLTGLPVATQKVMYKGSTQDEQTLKQLKITKSAKFMVIGSTINDLLKVATPSPTDLHASSDDKGTASSKEPLCKQTAHKKVLDKHGKPDDVPAGIKGSKMALPQTPLTGMYNKYGGKTRLTFKLDSDEVWIGTKERTQKVKMGSIKAVVSEPIEGHEDYHVMGLQLGPTEASKYWVYWVPAQYVNAIKDTILGKWELF